MKAAAARNAVTILGALFAFSAAAQERVILGSTTRGVVVAREGRAELHDLSTKKIIWRHDSVAFPSRIITGASRIAIIDPLANDVQIIDFAGATRRVRVSETPIDGIFIGGELFLLARDARVVERISAKGATTRLATGGDPAFIRVANEKIYVYSRNDGLLEEITTAPFTVTRRVTIAPFASDFETDGRAAYFCHARRGKIQVVDLGTMKSHGEIAVGSVPIDLTIASRSSALTARTLAVADPGAKRVWIVEGSQSTTEAFARGFLRGLIGLGLFGNRSSQFPTGIDRVTTRGRISVAFDSSTGTLYRFSKSTSSIIAKDLLPAGFTLVDGGIAIWSDGRLRVIP